MKETLIRAVVLASAFVSFGVPLAAVAQDASKPPYMNPELRPEVRAKDLVGHMTLEEKASQLVNEARAIPRLKVPSYDWWSESRHGVAVSGTTEFPEPVGLAATFDAPAIHEMAIAIGTEGRIVNAHSVKDGNSSIFHGLDFWAPNLEHLSRSTVGARARDLWGGSLSHRADGRGVCDRDAGG